MKTIDNAEMLVKAIADHFSNNVNSKALVEVAQFWGGFETWLRGEICRMLVNDPWNRQPWGGMNDGEWGTVGVEYTARLLRPQRPRREESKRVDLWVSQERGDETYYVELKTAFNNANRWKMRESWLLDATKLARIDEKDGQVKQSPAGWASIMFGVGWDATGWNEYVCDEKALLVELASSEKSWSSVRLAAIYSAT